jgi:hypothetical protein
MPTREEMNDALRKTLVPVLRQRGFTGSLPHFRRIASDRIDLLTIQFDKWGGGFVVEVAKARSDGFTTRWGEKIAPGKLKAHDLHPIQRMRLGVKGLEGDHWFRYDTGRALESVAQEVVSCMEQAEAWWARAASE